MRLSPVAEKPTGESSVGPKLRNALHEKFTQLRRELCHWFACQFVVIGEFYLGRVQRIIDRHLMALQQR